jgi:hypothetical protein
MSSFQTIPASAMARMAHSMALGLTKIISLAFESALLIAVTVSESFFGTMVSSGRPSTFTAMA